MTVVREKHMVMASSDGVCGGAAVTRCGSGCSSSGGSSWEWLRHLTPLSVNRGGHVWHAVTTEGESLEVDSNDDRKTSNTGG